MVKKPGKDGKIGGIKSTQETREVERTHGVSSVDTVKAATGILGVGQAGQVGRRRPTRTMTLAEREELFKMIDEEAGKIFGDTGISQEKRELVETAVKMAVESGLLDEGDKTPPPGPTSPKPESDPSKKKKLI